jgi:NhaP-type Na+/H+ or K+/H+ antiporter
VLKTMLTYVENVIVIVAVGVSVHYLAGLDWPWAILIGAAVSVALRWLLRSVGVTRVRKPPLTGGG